MTVKKISHKVGQAPGNLDYTGQMQEIVSTSVVRSYNESEFEESTVDNISSISKLIENNNVNWVEYTGFNNIDEFTQLGDMFGLHSLLLEDILHTNHLPSFIESEDYSAIILKSFIVSNDGELKENQVAIVILDNTVILFQETSNEILRNKIERIRQGKGRARKLKADYLFYIILDGFIDTYYLAFDELNHKILSLEEKLLADTNDSFIGEIHQLKSKLNNIRRILFPLRESVKEMLNGEIDFIKTQNRTFYKDIEDHLNQLNEFYISYNDQIKGLVDLNSSNLNNNINAVMKTLTIISTIFIPLTFIAGLYGMNFVFMPELNHQYGYPIILAVMIIVGLTMVLYMKRKKWF